MHSFSMEVTLSLNTRTSFVCLRRQRWLPYFIPFSFLKWNHFSNLSKVVTKLRLKVSKETLVLTRCSSKMAIPFLESKNPASKAIYAETNRQVEKWSKFIILGIAKVTPFFLVWPKFVVSLVTYFTTDLGSDALELPFPML